jgi:carboxyl-terminal processing protease
MIKKISKKKASNPLQKIPYISVGILILAIVFGSGYFIGNSSSFSKLNITARADDSVDLDPFWKVWEILDAKYIPASSTTQISNTDKIYGAISGMVESLDDPYTVFLKPTENENFRESIQGNFSGVGMEVGMEDDMITVIAPLKNTPAQKAGVRSGDVIVEIDKISTIGMSLDDAVGLIRGEVGSEVVLKVLREGVSDPIDISIIRDIIDIPVIDTEIKDDVFVISMYNFSANASNAFRNALRSFVISGRNKLILDLRGNPGGYLEHAVDVASWFLPAGRVIVQEDFGNDEVKYLRSKGYNVATDNLNMVILIDRGSASASEIVAGALQEYNIATLVGTQTFGKGSVQELIDVTPETSLKVTIARWLTPEGKSISDGGLTPDVVIDQIPEELETEDYNFFDYQLDEAIRILNN